MLSHKAIEFIFQMTLLFVLFLSFYISVSAFLTKKHKRSVIYNTWQFPMLLALYIDALNI
jgi:hypothetical protein